jgi:hypothetical protein
MWSGMNRQDSKCVGKIRYKTRAEAEKMAAGTKGVYQSHGCECGAFHVSKVKRTAKEEARAQAAEYYGIFEPLVRTMINREVEKMRRAGMRPHKRKPGKAQ